MNYKDLIIFLVIVNFLFLNISAEDEVLNLDNKKIPIEYQN